MTHPPSPQAPLPRVGIFICRALGPQLVDLCLWTLLPQGHPSPKAPNNDADNDDAPNEPDVEIIHHIGDLSLYAQRTGGDLRALLGGTAPDGEPSALSAACNEVCEALRGLDVILTYGDARAAFKGVCLGLSSLFLQRQPLPALDKFHDLSKLQALDIHTAAEGVIFHAAHLPPTPDRADLMLRMATADAAPQAQALMALAQLRASHTAYLGNDPHPLPPGVREVLSAFPLVMDALAPRPDDSAPLLLDALKAPPDLAARTVPHVPAWAAPILEASPSAPDDDAPVNDAADALPASDAEKPGKPKADKPKAKGGK